MKVDLSEIVNTRPGRPIAEKRILYLSSEDGIEAPLDDMETMELGIELGPPALQ